MGSETPKKARVGTVLEDLCRVCKMVRNHTVAAAALDGTIHRVLCDHCGSQHNYRGGGPAAGTTRGASRDPGATRHAGGTGGPFPPVSERERSYPVMTIESAEGSGDLEMLLRKIIREETGLTPVVPSDKWRGGDLVLRPGREGLQEKTLPIETFFNKIVMVRNRLRVLEQQINGTDLPVETKAKLQGYITGCYGSLTSFNVLFADEADRFSGAGGKK